MRRWEVLIYIHRRSNSDRWRGDVTDDMFWTGVQSRKWCYLQNHKRRERSVRNWATGMDSTSIAFYVIECLGYTFLFDWGYLELCDLFKVRVRCSVSTYPRRRRSGSIFANWGYFHTHRTWSFDFLETCVCFASHSSCRYFIISPVKFFLNEALKTTRPAISNKAKKKKYRRCLAPETLQRKYQAVPNHARRYIPTFAFSKTLYPAVPAYHVHRRRSHACNSMSSKISPNFSTALIPRSKNQNGQYQ